MHAHKNSDKIVLLKQLHEAINDQLVEAIEQGLDEEAMENLPLYTIGVGSKVFRFPATIIYRVMFDKLFMGWDELCEDDLAGVEASPDEDTRLTKIAEAYDGQQNLLELFDD